MSCDPDASLRLFFGLKLAAEMRSPVVALQERLRATGAKVKWVEPENLHFTLRFLGARPTSIVPDLKRLGGQVAEQFSPWELTLEGLGAFPKPRHPQTLYVSVGRGAEPLTRLAHQLSRALAEGIGLASDHKPFVPHCTLGRVRPDRGPGGLVAALEAEAGFTVGPMICSGFSLLNSQLTPGGPVYTELAHFAFTAERHQPA